MGHRDSIEEFIGNVRKRLNRHRAATTSLWAIGLGAAALLVVALTYILRGYAVPIAWYGTAAVVTLLGGVIAIAVRRVSNDEAAHFADGFYDLKDSISSARAFREAHKNEGFYALQIDKTQSSVEQLAPAEIRFHVPKLLSTAAVVLFSFSLLTAFKGHSPEVLAKIALEERTEGLTDEFSEKLLEELEELEKSIDDPEEKKLLDAEELRKWVEKLEKTKSQKEAMRQLAELEKKITQMANKLSQKKTEQLMAKLAKELREEPQHKELAEKLKQKNYKDAAKELSKLKPTDKKKLSEQKRELAKLKSAARRMASAARSSKSRMSSQNGNSRNSQQNSSQQMDELMESLDQDVQELDEDLEELELAERQGELSEADLRDLELIKAQITDKLDNMGDKLKALFAAKKMQKKLFALSKKLGQCQNCMAGLCQSPFAAPGGKKPGAAGDDKRRDQQDELVDNGQYTELKGTKGQGPSLTKLEAAEDGTGISHIKAEKRQRTFQRQFESFVEREDVPEDVKGAVKSYFTTIHEGVDPADAPGGSAPEGE